MICRNSNISTRCRIIAAVVFFVWTSSLALCTAHCSLGVSHLPWAGKEEAIPSCHAASPNTSSCHDDSSEAPAKVPSSSFCATFKNLFAKQADASISQPVQHVLYVIAASAFLPLPDLSTQDVSARQHHPPDFTITPEVYLGPALHSLAPPLS